MPNLIPKDVRLAIEAALERVTVRGEHVHTAADRAALATERFDPDQLLQYADGAAVLVGALSQSRHLRDLFETLTPSGGQFDLDDVLRLKRDGQSFDGVMARRHTTSYQRQFGERGAKPTDRHPAYIFEAGNLLEIISSGGRNLAGAEATAIAAPIPVPRAAEVTLSGSTLSIDSGDDVEEVHEGGIMHLTSGSDEYNAEIIDPAGVEVDTAAPDGAYDAAWVTHGFTRLDERHEGAIVNLAAAMCFASLGQQGRFEAALTRFSREMAPHEMAYFDVGEVDWDQVQN